MGVDNVTVRDGNGFMQRTKRLKEKSGLPMVTENIRVMESAQEISFRPVKGGTEGEEERIFALRTDPLRFEMYSRNSKDQMRMDWQAPRSVAMAVFEVTASVAGQ